MAMTQEQIRGLDQLRQRLSQLANSVASLRREVENQNPLPTWEILQESAQVLSLNLTQITEIFSSHAQFLKEAHAYPLTNFPGPTQEPLLGQLMRKKLEPSVENWIHDNTTKARSSAQANGEAKTGGMPRNEELRNLWTWAETASKDIVAPMLGDEEGGFADDFTLAEREAGVENVVTGLRRNLNGDSDDDEADADDDDEVEGINMEDVTTQGKAVVRDEEGTDPFLPPMPLESVLRFMTTGTVPSGGRLNA